MHQIRRSEFTWSDSKRVLRSIECGVALLSWCMPSDPPLGIHMVGKQESIKKYRGVGRGLARLVLITKYPHPNWDPLAYIVQICLLFAN